MTKQATAQAPTAAPAITKTDKSKLASAASAVDACLVKTSDALWTLADLVVSVATKHGGESSLTAIGEIIGRNRLQMSELFRTATTWPADQRIAGMSFAAHTSAVSTLKSASDAGKVDLVDKLTKLDKPTVSAVRAIVNPNPSKSAVRTSTTSAPAPAAPVTAAVALKGKSSADAIAVLKTNAAVLSRFTLTAADVAEVKMIVAMLNKTIKAS